MFEIKGTAESGRIKEEVRKFINEKMNGLDIGSGGAPIFIQSISLDKKFEGRLSNLIQLKGDARDLYWFKDEVLDYVFSSHCLEDFSDKEKPGILKEWTRVIKIKGYLILYLPNEQKYREYCNRQNAERNVNHKDINFDIFKLRLITNTMPNLKEIYSIEHHESYSFFTVYRKMK